MLPRDPWLLRIAVISDDPEFINECMAASEAFLKTVCEPIRPTSFTSAHQCDVCVWDYQDDEAVLTVLANFTHARILIVAESVNFSPLREILPQHEVSFLRRPATTASLRPFLEHATMHARREMSRRSAPSEPDIERDWTMQLLEANFAFQRTNQLQISVLADSIQDLGGPLIALQGYCDLLRLNECGTVSGQQAEIIRNMQRSLRRMCVTVSALQMSLSGETVIDVVSSDAGLDAYIDQAIEDVLPAIEEKRIRLSVNLDPAQGTLRFSSSQIEHVFLNLLENACRCAPREGMIEVLGYSSGTSHQRPESEPSKIESYRIDIRDSGPPVPVRMLPCVFDELPSGDERNGRTMGGLGLASCRMILSAHQGALWADSDPSGTTFSLSLPYQDCRAGHQESNLQNSFLKREYV